MLEWLKRHAWKACNRQNRFAGSNPVLSARLISERKERFIFELLFLYIHWRKFTFRQMEQLKEVQSKSLFFLVIRTSICYPLETKSQEIVSRKNDNSKQFGFQPECPIYDSYFFSAAVSRLGFCCGHFLLLVYRTPFP